MSALARELEAMRRRLGTVASDGGNGEEQSALSDVVQQLRSRVEALGVAEQELRQQNEELVARERLLARVSELLSRWSPSQAPLEEMARLLVPALADWCSVDSVEGEGAIAPSALVADSAETAAALDAWRPVGRPAQDHPLARVVETGRAELIECVGGRVPAEVVAGNQALDVQGIEVAAWMGVPLTARDRLLGTISLWAIGGRKGFARKDVLLVEEIARRAALVIDHACLLERATGERDRLLQLLDRLEQGVLGVDSEGLLAFANPAAFRLIGSGLADGHPLPEPWPSFSFGGLVPALFAHAAEPVHADVSTPHGSYAVAGIPAGSSDLAVLVVTDLSAHKRRQLVEREFVTNAAHELQTPLTAIIGAAEVLQSGAKEVPKERDLFLGHIEREAGRLARLTRALLLLARVQNGEQDPLREPVPLQPLLENAGRGVWRANHIDVEVDCPVGLSAFGDPDLLEQIVGSLAANAARYTHEGRVVLAAKARGTTDVAIEVRDTGQGISANELDRVFEPFYRGSSRDSTGFGLGLSIVAQAVKALGGRIEVDTEPGHGTTMRLVLQRGSGDR